MTPHPRRPVASEMHLPVPPTLHHQFLGSTSLGWRHLLRERNLELLLYSQNSKNGKFEKSLMLSRLRDKFLRSPSRGSCHLLRERNLELLLYSQNSKNGKFEKSLMLSRLRDKFLRR